jgi:uncharacterized protein
VTTEHEAILKDWRKNSAKHEGRNFRFLRSLKLVPDPERIDALARELHEEAFRKIDCTRCASCCKSMTVAVSGADIDRIAGHLRLTREAFIADYLEVDEEEGGYRMKSIPCPFLHEDRCTIYQVRPATCAGFPHTLEKGFIHRTYLHSANTRECPAVYYIVEEMRDRLRK